ncbi:Ferric reduction oxidase 7, chloroplastic [Apostasia shenzhenica]|uniref:Ferric reduction oxidase 7, chloroplastic n=1 Tax=Apostasia shenzhenica TaxID=1088818 RepID=A0A2I0BG36_9ASPA|nr:Ferric reduction oxidase 7, chloroplastic [Apostasia shenzhenica]
MAELSAEVPLLAKSESDFRYSKNESFLPVLAKWSLKCLIWFIFLVWIAAIFLFPTDVGRKLLFELIGLTRESAFGITGSIFLGFSAPVLVIAFLAFIYVASFSGGKYERETYKTPRFRLWTFPVLTDGPFGVLCATEFIGILLFAAYVLWSVTVYAVRDHRLIQRFSFTIKDRSCLMLELTGLHFGIIGLFCLAFLFLPVARGSILLRLIDIPFEQATRYHVWLGHLTMAIFTLHGSFYVIAWGIQGRLHEKIVEWADIGVANLPGVISLAAGLLMWVTSLRPVRRNYFELFFYTHQLYIIFVVFLALHVGDFIFCYAAGAIFLFILDRFLRFYQSRPTVDVLSAACRPCGTLELTLSKPQNLQYSALSFIFLQIREISWLQWHPFSVSSSPLDGEHHLTVLIKVLGEWTEKLRDLTASVSDQPSKVLQQKIKRISVSVEGPYGHEVPYHLMYENLILVAGGIGISPFFAILSDVLHLTSDGKPCFPKNILVLWAVKKSNELSLLSTIDGQFVCPSSFNNLNLRIQTYVTRESEPPLEDGLVNESKHYCSLSTTSGNSISCLVGTGYNVMAAAYVLISTVGLILLYALLELYYFKPLKVFAWWYRGLLFTLTMVASAVVLGSFVIFVWNKSESNNSSCEKLPVDCEKNGLQNRLVIHDGTSKENLRSVQTIHYGSRPDFREIFSSYAEKMGHVNVGVIICGPPSLQSSVARECRHQNVRGKWNHPIFHFNSHSFDL